VIDAAYVSPPPGQPRGELRVRIGDEITIEAADIAADKLYVRLGTLDPIRVTAGAGQVRIVVPDDFYPADLDNPIQRPIPGSQRLQPGSLPVQLLAEATEEGVEGGLDRGRAVTGVQRRTSNLALLQLVPGVATVTSSTEVVAVTGTRLWHPAAHTVEVAVGDAAVPVRAPGPGDPWAAPTPTRVEIAVADVVATLQHSGLASPYPVAVEVDGARSRDAVTLALGP
jgi:hypothetical protein